MVGEQLITVTMLFNIAVEEVKSKVQASCDALGKHYWCCLRVLSSDQRAFKLVVLINTPKTGLKIS